MELLIGEQDPPAFDKILKRLSVSSDEFGTEISELSDPLHDSSLLSDLFYTTKIRNDKAEESSIIFTEDDTTLSVKEDVNDHQVSNKKTRKQSKEIEANQSLSDETLTSFENADLASTKIENEDESLGSEFNYKKLLPDTLSVETLTLLGRVKSAKVTVQNLALVEAQPLGCVYFIEYKFPVTAYETEASSLASETVCNVSKSVSNREEILFERISVFPLCFNEEMVSYWWNTKVDMRVSVKFNRNQKQILLGEAALDLRCILVSEDMASNQLADVYSVDGKRENIGVIKVGFSFLSFVNTILETCGKY